MSSSNPTSIRERLESTERSSLSPHAALASESKGRPTPEEEHPYRTAYQRDRDRILHSKAFRRLKGKTQVFLAPKGDHYRTRLTHTLEVAQISRTAARALFLNEDLTEAIALGHDLGHTPFGHAGESMLNEIYPGGFRHFEQSLRVVDKLESRSKRQGLNLTQEVRDGILFHSKGKVVLLGRDGEKASTLEGQVMSVCDAIAYINHDIDDAIRAGVITLNDLPRDAIALVGDAPSKRISTMVDGLIAGSSDGVIDITADVKDAINALRDYLYANVYPSDAINHEIGKAKKILVELYGYLMEHPAGRVADYPEEDDLERRVVDVIAGMTDHYALELYQQLFFPESWPV
jgi:dGTPase